MNSTSPIKVSVIVNVYNEEAVILTVLQSIRESWFPGMEVIISDDGSTDTTAEIIKEFKEKNDAERLILYSHENLRHAGARNAGAKIAKGEYLFFMDGDTTLPKGMVENSLRELENKHFDVVSHYFKSDRPGFRSRLGVSLSNLGMRISLSPIIPGGGGILIRKELFNAVGGFPHKELSEDLAFARVLTAHGAKIGLLKERMPMNTRRFEVEGLISTFRVWIRALLYHILKRDFKKGEVEYKNIREARNITG